MAQCAVRLRKVPTKRQVAGRTKLTLAKDIRLLTGLDVSDTVVQVMACEIKEQESIGNDPTEVRINGGKGPQNIRTSVRLNYKSKPSTLVYRATAFFGKAEDMKKAAFEAYRMLREVTRIATGTSKQNFMVYVGRVGKDGPGRALGLGAVGLTALNTFDLDADSTISIVGPLTVYGRRLYWNPEGGKTVVRRFPGTREAKKQLGVSIRGGFIGSATMHQDVKKRLRKKVVAKSFVVADPFYSISSRRIQISPKEGKQPSRAEQVATMIRPLRMPAITIQLRGRRRGR